MELWKAVFAAAVTSRGWREPESEYVFHPERKWRFDLAWPDYKVAFEREGGTWSGGRHNRGKGYASDCRKYNAAQLDGWIVIRGTVDLINNGTALVDLLAALVSRVSTPDQT